MKILKSRTFWTLVFMFVFNGFQAISGGLPEEVSVVVNTALTSLAMYFKFTPSQTY